MRDSYPPGAFPREPSATTTFPVPPPPKFPTPDEIRKRHAALVAPRVNAVVAAIREAVEKNGARQCSVLASWASGDEDLIRAAIEPSGWRLEFGSDQRDGSWIKVTPR
jgi:hypothetical protein